MSDALLAALAVLLAVCILLTIAFRAQRRPTAWLRAVFVIASVALVIAATLGWASHQSRQVGFGWVRDIKSGTFPADSHA